MPRILPDTLSTERLILREPRLTDAEQIFEKYGQDPEVSKYMVWRPLTALSEAQGFIQQAISDWQSGERFAYVLELKSAPGEMIGMLDACIHGATIDIGYVLARETWGQGLMPEAVSALVKIALADPSIFRVQASCDVDNIPSMRTLEKAGFQREGCLARYTRHPNISDEPRDCFMYGLCR